MPDMSRESPFDVFQDRPDSGATPMVLDDVSSIMIRGCWSTCRLDCSAVVRNTGFITWDTIRRLRLRSSFSTTLASFSPTCRCCSNWSLPSIEHRLRSCGSRSVGGRFRRMLCSMWCRRTGFVGWHIIWRLWACGGHLLLRTFGDPCRRRHAMLACCAMTVFRICHSNSIWKLQ